MLLKIHFLRDFVTINPDKIRTNYFNNVPISSQKSLIYITKILQKWYKYMTLIGFVELKILICYTNNMYIWSKKGEKQKMKKIIHTKNHENVVTVESYSLLNGRKKDCYKKLYKLIM